MAASWLLCGGCSPTRKHPSQFPWLMSLGSATITMAFMVQHQPASWVVSSCFVFCFCFVFFLPQVGFFLLPSSAKPLLKVFNLSLVGRHSSKFHNFFLHSPLSLRVVSTFCSCHSVPPRVLFYPLS